MKKTFHIEERNNKKFFLPYSFLLSQATKYI